ncbi:type I-C CRISPR-associated protein Cas8c/Csd1 [Priestia koreensis]|uniref:type I-C CRISPR-associated protein Cas8c/Csd1 n=1 Tax=Priestia koreensis TaxID=284581 RepID=UPI003018F7D0
MSWLLNLYETYEANLDRVGKVEQKHNGQEYTLIPISHTTQNAHIEVEITENGLFHSARVLDKSEFNTVIPCTEDAASRSGTIPPPYPLHDKLQYVAGDFSNYTGNAKSDRFYLAYINQLGKWVNSTYSISKVKSVYQYLQKKTLIEDLIDSRILWTDQQGRLVDKWEKKYEDLYPDKPDIFLTIPGGIEDAFVRFNIYSHDSYSPKVWRDPNMYQSFISYYNDALKDPDFCYVTGKYLPVAIKHANKIRNAGDQAKLISSKDKAGFTFRGRFSTSHEVASVSYEVSQKAHNALKWLIHKQGKVIDKRVFLIWENKQNNTPDFFDDPFSLEPYVVEKKTFTNKEFAKEVSKALDGYRSDLDIKSEVNILILDAATTGRLAVLYYRNLDKNLYLDRLKAWYTTCLWHQPFYKKEEKRFIQVIGTPVPKDIAFGCFGSKVNDKVIKSVVERLSPCILDGKKIPTDLIRNVVIRASNPLSMDTWEWEKTLSIACALVNKEERYEMSLDVESQDRDYLFGRLLAIADVLERRALANNESRPTNAMRYMTAFSKHPLRTWKVIQELLQPYQIRLGSNATYLTTLIDEVASKIDFSDFNNQPLSGKYLLGFYSQRHELYKKKESVTN